MDWKVFRAAAVAGTLPAELANACSLAWSWLDLPREGIQNLVHNEITTESAAKYLLQALSLVRRRLWREANFDPDDPAKLQAFFTTLNEGKASAAERQLFSRIEASNLIGDALGALYPTKNSVAFDPQQAVIAANVPALTDAIEATYVGSSSPEAIAALHTAIDAFERIGGTFTGQPRIDFAWWMGLAWWALGRGLGEVHRHPDALDAFNRSAAFYDQAGEVKSASDCRKLASDLKLGLAADFDAAAGRDIRDVLASQEPLERARSLSHLLRTFGAAGDRFEAARIAEDAAKILAGIGYPDPEHNFDAAVERWIQTAAVSCTGNAVFARLCEITEGWCAILGARTSARLLSDPSGSLRAERVMNGLASLAGELSKQADQAHEDAAKRFAIWAPDAPEVPLSTSHIDDSKRRLDAINELDHALQGVRDACNEGASEALAISAENLRAEAERLASPPHAARALIEAAYVRLALRQFDHVPALCRGAVNILLAGQPASLSAFATGYEREMYIMAIDFEARALAQLGEHESLLALCQPVIRDIEAERARVSSPYQQSAFLETRSELYEFVVAAAYRTKRLDLMLSVTELLKAQLAVRNRFVAAIEDTSLVADEQFREVNEALLRAPAGSSEESDLRQRRRWLMTARAITHSSSSGASIPELSIAAIQAVLAADEAAITWFWVGAETVVALAITQEDAHSTVISLDETQGAQLSDYLDCVSALAGGTPPLHLLIPRTGALVSALGSVLLPSGMGDFIEAKSRLVLCPHRTLHLFPFHAISWRDGFLIERFSIRYVPNLTSLLLPWQGNTEGPVLAVGVKNFVDPGVPPLPNAEDEAAAVAAAHGEAGQLLIGATRAEFAALHLQDFRCLHFATHGSSVLAGDAVDDPLQACLFLRDGALTGWEISAMPLHAELVVLAACHSGQRSIAGRGLDKLPGDDIFGLQAVLFEAGVNMLLGALWPVEDTTSQAIVVDFHRAYASGDPPADALAVAIRNHLAQVERKQQLFYWAPFFVSSLGCSRAKAVSAT